MKFCNYEDGVCKHFFTYNGKKCCGQQFIKDNWSRTISGSKWGNILKAYLKQFGTCNYYEGRFKKDG